jgi:flagellar hook assembly protein FlgD/flagellar motor protein MotB
MMTKECLMTRPNPTILVLILLTMMASTAMAFDPPAGGDALPVLSSPVNMAGGATVASTESPSADVLNPASSGAVQRTTFDASYVALAGLGSETGLGHALNLGVAVPRSYGVWTGQLGLIHSPFDALSWGTLFTGRIGMAKDLTDELLIGLAVDTTLGSKDGFGWGLAADVGAQGSLGQVGFMNDFRWGAAFRNLGRAYSNPGSTGISGAQPADSFDSPFTPVFGASADLLEAEKAGLVVGASLDLGFPTFQNAILAAGLTISWKDRLFVRTGWDFNFQEAFKGVDQGLMPSFGIGGSFSLKPAPAGQENQGFQGSEVRPAVSAYQLPSGVWAFGTGASLALGPLDREGPAITVDYPATAFDAYYISPNGDGIRDTVVLPLRMADRRYVKSYELRVLDEAGTLVRTIGDSENRPDAGGLKGFLARLRYVKKDVSIPAQLVWDGRSDTGQKVEDGLYSIEISAADDNGFTSVSRKFLVMVDTVAPKVEIAGPPGPDGNIFSPDGDGNKDTLAITQSGSAEDLWIAEVLDAAGSLMRRWEFKDTTPGELVWDGKNDEGQNVPDGIYLYRISSTDRAGNRGSARIDPIMVNNQRAPIGISVDLPAFSPNGDGVLDVLTLSPNVTVRSGIARWQIAVVDAAGKDRWTVSGTGAESLQTQYAFAGKDDAGQLLPDGTYRSRLFVVYANGHSPIAWSNPFIIDVVFPTISLAPPTGPDALIFSPDGDGSKDTFAIRQSGSAEDLWSATIQDAAGTLMRRWEYRNGSPVNIVWDGKDDGGQVVPDGVYSYRISSTDMAGNRVSARIDNIIVNTLQPPVSIAIDLAAFSPNGDGVKDVLTLNPGVPVRTGIASWSMAVVDAGDTERWTVSGTGADLPRASYAFAGRDAANAPLPEGSYRTRLSVRYVNGHHPEAWSPAFLIDLTPPKATVAVDQTVFNPLGDARTSIVITQSGSTEDEWTAAMINAAGRAVKSWTFIGAPDPVLSWDGSDEAGKVVDDGSYTYRLGATDRAGNAGLFTSPQITVNTEAKDVRLSLDKRAFGPNGNGINESVGIGPTSTSTNIATWTLDIHNQAGQIVRSFTGQGALPRTVEWNGRTTAGTVAPDGVYQARMDVVYSTGERKNARSVDLVLDTVYPDISISTEYKLFSPNGDGRKDVVRIEQRSGVGDTWEGQILNARNVVVRSWAWKDRAATVEWDGTDTQGNRLPDGVYRYVVKAEDAAGNRTEKSIDGLTIDTRATQVFVTASLPGFSPNGDGRLDDISFSLLVNLRDGIQSWRLALVDQGGVARRTFSGTGTTPIPATQVWDGKSDSGPVFQGTYTAVFTVDYHKGDRAEARSAPFVLDSLGPQVALSVSPRLFSPDGDGIDDELNISLAVSDASDLDAWRFEIIEVAVVEGAGAARERSFFAWNGRGTPAERLVWDGRSQRGELVEAATDYLYRFTITDILGNRTTSEGVISIDVLVIREGDRLKIKVPSIVFRPNFADFNELPKETVDRNNEVLQRIAQILNRFRDYRVGIEGHANSIAKMNRQSQAAIEREENTELIPLSRSRAEAVRQKLVEFGVASSRLSVVGRGSSEPVVPFTDAENRWKNRRVEFILIRQ